MIKISALQVTGFPTRRVEFTPLPKLFHPVCLQEQIKELCFLLGHVWNHAFYPGLKQGSQCGHKLPQMPLLSVCRLHLPGRGPSTGLQEYGAAFLQCLLSTSSELRIIPLLLYCQAVLTTSWRLIRLLGRGTA